MTQLTDGGDGGGFNRGMASSITVIFVLLIGGQSALRNGRRHNDLITPRPYNNLHSDATAARDEHTLLS